MTISFPIVVAFGYRKIF